MSIIYRPHRVSIIDSMKESKEFNSENEMKDYIVKQNMNKFTKDDIVLSDEMHCDIRIGWNNVRLICVEKYNNKKYENPICIGMCATDYKKWDGNINLS